MAADVHAPGEDRLRSLLLRHSFILLQSRNIEVHYDWRGLARGGPGKISRHLTLKRSIMQDIRDEV